MALTTKVIVIVAGATLLCVESTAQVDTLKASVNAMIPLRSVFPIPRQCMHFFPFARMQYPHTRSMTVRDRTAILSNPIVAVVIRETGTSTIRFRGETTRRPIPAREVPWLLQTLQTHHAPELEALDLVLATSEHHMLNALFADAVLPHLRDLRLVGVRVPRSSVVFQAPLTQLCVTDAGIWKNWTDVAETLRGLPSLERLTLENVTKPNGNRPPVQQPFTIPLHRLTHLRIGVAESWRLMRDVLSCFSLPPNLWRTFVTTVREDPRHSGLKEAIAGLHNYLAPEILVDHRYTMLSIHESATFQGLTAPKGCVFTTSNALRTQSLLAPQNFHRFPDQFTMQFDWAGDRSDADIPAMCSLMPRLEFSTLTTLRVAHGWFQSAAEWITLYRECRVLRVVETIWVAGAAQFRGLLQALALEFPTSPPDPPRYVFPAMATVIVEDVDFTPPAGGPPAMYTELVKMLEVRWQAGRAIGQVTVLKCSGDEAIVAALHDVMGSRPGLLGSVVWDDTDKRGMMV